VEVWWWEWLIPLGIGVVCLIVAVLRDPLVTFRRGLWRSGWTVGLALAATWLCRAVVDRDEPMMRRVLLVALAAGVVAGAGVHRWRYRRIVRLTMKPQ
jgi:hypothetical protein